jgi:beta-galactosidase
VEVEEYDSLPPGETRKLRFLHRQLRATSGPYPACWCDVLRLRGAEALAVYEDGHYRGSPAITVNRRGKGRVVYLGVASDRSLYSRLCRWLCSEAGIRPTLEAPPGVEATERRAGDSRLLFLLNHSDQPRTIRLGRRHYIDVIDGSSPVPRRLLMHPRGVRVLAKGASDA